MIFLVCAAVGGTLLLCQFVLNLLSLGHHDVDHDHTLDQGHDVDHDHDSSWYVGILTFRAVVTAVTFFGLGGLVAVEATLGPEVAIGLAVASGAGALFAVAWLMKSLHHLKDDGTVHIDRAVGKTGIVYLSIPANQSGAGKVTVKVQNRTVEYLAVTRQESLATGTPVQVVAVISSNTVEVAPVPQPQKVSHV
jgi:hypothetical protein